MTDATEVGGDVAALQNEITTLKSQVADLVSHLSDQAVATAGAVGGEIQDRATHAIRAAKEQGQVSIKAISDRIEERPIAALLIALGVGYVAGRLLTR